MVAWPTADRPGLGLQTMKFESQMPAQTNPAGETVTSAVLLLEKLTSATTAPPRGVLGRRDKLDHLRRIQGERSRGEERSG